MKTILKILVFVILVFTNSYAQLTHTITQTAHINDGSDAYLVEVGTDGAVFVVGSDNLSAYNYDGSSFINTDYIYIPYRDYSDLLGYPDIAVGNDGTIFVAIGNNGLWAHGYDGSSFTTTSRVLEDSGSATSVAIGPDETVFLANGLDGLRAYTYEGSSFTNTAHIDDGGDAMDVAIGSDSTVFLINGDNLSAYSYDGSSFTIITNVVRDAENIFGIFDNYIFGREANIQQGWLSVYKYEDSRFTKSDSSFFSSRGNFDLAIGTDGTFFVIHKGQLKASTYDGSSFTITAEIQTTGQAAAVGLDGTVFVASGSNGLFAYEYAISTVINEETSKIPVVYKLSQNYPNPFNPSTTIEFTLPNSEFVELKVYNILGKEVSTLVSKKLNQGNHSYTFNGKNLASGIYYYQMVSGDYREVKKMILLR